MEKLEFILYVAAVLAFLGFFYLMARFLQVVYLV